MKGEEINVIENLIQAISILNKTEEYFLVLNDKLSEYDSMNSDFEHFIEFTPIEKVNLELLFKSMQEMYSKRRKVKNDMTISKNFKNNINKLLEVTNREFLIQTLKSVDTRNSNLEYSNRVLSEDDLKKFIKKENLRGRGRPKKKVEDENDI